jgi:hypothetical protein
MSHVRKPLFLRLFVMLALVLVPALVGKSLDQGGPEGVSRQPSTSPLRAAPAQSQAEATATPASHGVAISGTVRLGGPDGPGLAGVRIHRSVREYPGDDAPSVMTDREGRYHFDLLPLAPEPDQWVYVRPVLDGHVFLPEWRWHVYGGSGREAVALDFEARAVPSPERARFRLGFTASDASFVIELADPERITAARAELAKPREERMGVMGQIVKRPASYNPGWSYHLDPATIALFDMAVEVCDGNPQYIEEHLDEVCGALLPRCSWCPWSSFIAAELPAAQAGTVFLPVLLDTARLGLPTVRVIDRPIRPDAWPSDPLEIVAARVEGDRLLLALRYSGGCRTHGLELVASSLFMESFPVQADLLLAHDDHDDPCDGIVGREVAFDLAPLREAYDEAYPGDSGPMLLVLRGWEERLRYDFGPRP